MDQKKRIFFHKSKKNFGGFVSELTSLCEGLLYESETDARVVPVVLSGPGMTAAEAVGTIAGERNTAEIDPGRFFARLTNVKDWFGLQEKLRAKKFLELHKLLEENLNDLKAYRIGDIRVTYCVLGVASGGQVAGIRTEAVET